MLRIDLVPAHAKPRVSDPTEYFRVSYLCVRICEIRKLVAGLERNRSDAPERGCSSASRAHKPPPAKSIEPGTVVSGSDCYPRKKLSLQPEKLLTDEQQVSFAVRADSNRQQTNDPQPPETTSQLANRTRTLHHS